MFAHARSLQQRIGIGIIFGIASWSTMQKTLSIRHVCLLSSTFHLAQTNMFPAVLRCQVSSRSYQPSHPPYTGHQVEFTRDCPISNASSSSSPSSIHTKLPEKNNDLHPERRGQRSMMTSYHSQYHPAAACTVRLGDARPRFPFPFLPCIASSGIVYTQLHPYRQPIAMAPAQTPATPASGCIFSTIGSSILCTYLEACERPVERRRLVTEGKISQQVDRG